MIIKWNETPSRQTIWPRKVGQIAFPSGERTLIALAVLSKPNLSSHWQTRRKSLLSFCFSVWAASTDGHESNLNLGEDSNEGLKFHSIFCWTEAENHAGLNLPGLSYHVQLSMFLLSQPWRLSHQIWNVQISTTNIWTFRCPPLEKISFYEQQKQRKTFISSLMMCSSNFKRN